MLETRYLPRYTLCPALQQMRAIPGLYYVPLRDSFVEGSADKDIAQAAMSTPTFVPLHVPKRKDKTVTRPLLQQPCVLTVGLPLLLSSRSDSV